MRTVTHKVTVTYTAPKQTTTVISTTTSTDFKTRTKVDTAYTTIESTAVATGYTTSTVDVTETLSTTITDFTTLTEPTTALVSASTTTFTTVNFTPAVPPPEDIKKDGLPAHGPSGLSPRQYPTCQRKTSKPTDIPGYAECCHGALAYASACSCIGATSHTTTLSGHKITETITMRTTVTPTVTQHEGTTVPVVRTKHITDYTTVQKTTTTTVFNTITESETTTVETDANTATSVVSATTTIATTSTVTTVTVGSTYTACPLLEWSGPNQGQYLAVDQSNDGFLYWTADIDDAADFALDASSRLVATNLFAPNLLVLALPNSSSFVPVQGDYQPGDDGLITLTCSFDVNFFLTCTPTGGGRNSIWLDTNQPGNSQYLAFGESSDTFSSGYTQVTIVSLCR